MSRSSALFRVWIWLVALLIGATWSTPSRADAGKLRASAVERMADKLVRRWAPVYVQHVDAEDSGADRPTRIDFDGDWDATNNWDNQALFGSALPPAAYGAAILTQAYAYLTYTLYYPRDWSSLICLPFVCHDNDLETVQLVVERDGKEGRLVEVRAKAHLDISDTAAETIARTSDGRPLLQVESQGHGISVCRRDDAGCTARAGRILYALGDLPSNPPVIAAGQTVRYDLLSLRDTLWARRWLSHDRLWTSGETGPLYYQGLRWGRRGKRLGASMAGSRYRGGVRPPWAIKGAVGQRGDWFLDPAAQHEAPGTRYVHNPFLDDLAAECTDRRCAPGPEREPSRLEYLASLAAPYVALSLGVVVVGGFLRHHAGALPFLPRSRGR